MILWAKIQILKLGLFDFFDLLCNDIIALNDLSKLFK